LISLVGFENEDLLKTDPGLCPFPEMNLFMMFDRSVMLETCQKL